MKLFFLIIFSFLFCSMNGQNGIGYFVSPTNEFTVFDKGKTIVLERTSVDSIRNGDNYLAYVDALANLKVYFDGEVHVIENVFPSRIIGTSEALVYKMQNRLMVYENGQKFQLANWTGQFWIGEEIVVWVDLPSYDIMAYSKGSIYTIEKSADLKTIKEFKVGRNIFVYNDLNNHLKVFYDGKVYNANTSNIVEFKCAKNIMAYYDDFYNEFKVFYKGEFKTISTFKPKEFEVSDDQIVYIDINDYFMVYYNDTITKLLSYHPHDYSTSNSILFYSYLMEYFIFYKGKVYSIEKFIPKKNVLIGFNSVLYLDNRNRIKCFIEGKHYESILIEKLKKKNLIRDLPVFNFGNNNIAFFYAGEVYKYSIIKTSNKH